MSTTFARADGAAVTATRRLDLDGLCSHDREALADLLVELHDATIGPDMGRGAHAHAQLAEWVAAHSEPWQVVRLNPAHKASDHDTANAR